METKYLILEEDEKDDIIVSYLLQQERDRYCHQLNLDRFSAMLKGIPDDDWRKNIAKLKEDTVARLAQLDGLIKATLPQLPDEARFQAAKDRLKKKRG